MTKVKAPAVYAYSKKIMPTNALMFSCDSEDKTNLQPIYIATKTVLGTQSHRTAKQKDAENGNIQQVNYATLPTKHDTLAVTYNVKFVSGVFIPEMCGDMEYAEAVEVGLADVDLKTLAYRYIYNIAAAKPLWRNRVAAEDITTVIAVDDESFEFDSYALDLQDFDEDDQVGQIANKVAAMWKSGEGFVTIGVKHYSQLGEGMDVYPSEEFVDGGKVSKVLFNINGQAAIHDQKLGNATRTIDNWYPDAEKLIAVEPFGSVVKINKAYRHGNKSDFYTLLAKVAKGDDLNEEDKMYVTANLIRGGVFGEK